MRQPPAIGLCEEAFEAPHGKKWASLSTIDYSRNYSRNPVMRVIKKTVTPSH